MAYQGSYATSTIVYWLFTTTVNGVPTTLSGSPALSVYKNSLTQSTAGVTLTVDYDGVTGQNQVKIDTSSDTTFYSDATQFSVQISAGTVGGSSVAGRNIGSFSLDAETIASTGNVTGGVTGGITGNVTGNLIGSVVNGPPRTLSPGIRGPFGVI